MLLYYIYSRLGLIFCALTKPDPDYRRSSSFSDKLSVFTTVGRGSLRARVVLIDHYYYHHTTKVILGNLVFSVLRVLTNHTRFR